MITQKTTSSLIYYNIPIQADIINFPSLFKNFDPENIQ